MAKFETRDWLLGALLTLVLALGGVAWTSQTSAVVAVESSVGRVETTQNEHGERIRYLEALLEQQVRINERLETRIEQVEHDHR